MEPKKQSKMRTGVLIGIVVLLISALLVGACAKAPAPSPTPAPGKPAAMPTPAPVEIVAKLYYYSSPTAETAILTKWWGETVSERTGGRLKFKYFYSESLAPPDAIIEGLKAGVFEVAVPRITIASQFPFYKLFSLPGLTGSDTAKMKAVLDLLEQVPEIQQSLAAWDVMYLGHFYFTPRQVNSKVPLYRLEDFKGLRMRSESDFGKAFKAIGANVISLPSPEIYTAFQRGMIDAYDCPWTVFDRFKTWEFAKYISTITVATGQNPFAMKKSFYERLPKDIQKVIQDVTRELPAKSEAYFIPEIARLRKVFEENGVKIIEFPAEDQAKFVEIGLRPQWDVWLKDMETEFRLGEVAKKTLATFLELIKKYEK